MGGGLGSLSSMTYPRHLFLEEQRGPCANKVAGPGDALGSSAGGCRARSPHGCCEELQCFLEAQGGSKGLLTSAPGMVSGHRGVSLSDWC